MIWISFTDCIYPTFAMTVFPSGSGDGKNWMVLIYFSEYNFFMGQCLFYNIQGLYLKKKNTYLSLLEK